MATAGQRRSQGKPFLLAGGGWRPSPLEGEGGRAEWPGRMRGRARLAGRSSRAENGRLGASGSLANDSRRTPARPLIRPADAVHLLPRGEKDAMPEGRFVRCGSALSGLSGQRGWEADEALGDAE